MDEALLRTLTPTVIGILVRRGADFAAAEDAVQDALVEAVRVWPDDPPRDPKGWLVTVAWRKFLDAARADTSRRHREVRVEGEPMPGPGEAVDDTLQLYFLCAHPSLTPASAVALTLRAVGGLTTRQIAQAYLVPEATMAQRISRAKRTVSGVRFNQPGDVATVLRVLYLVFNEGYSGDVDLAAEAIRLTRQLAARTNHEEVAGLLALMLLHHARRPARTGPDGRLVPLAEQDRSLWDTRLIAEGVDVLQAALARDRLGEFQAQAAIAALHADARTAEETDWVQIVEWYDELVRLTDSPVARLNRAVAVGEADGPRAGLAALAELDPALPRHTAVAAYLHERDGDPVDRGTALRRSRPIGAQPPRTRPPHATGRPAQRAAAQLDQHHAAERAWSTLITRAVAVAVAIIAPAESASVASRKARSPSRCTMRPVAMIRPGRTGRVEQHRRLERAEHVPGRVGEVLGGREGELDRAVLDVRADELEPQRGGRARHRGPSFDRVPEWPGALAHHFSSLIRAAWPRLPTVREARAAELNGFDLGLPRADLGIGPSGSGSAESRACRRSPSTTLSSAAIGMAMRAPIRPRTVPPIRPDSSTAGALRLTVERRMRGAR